MKFYEFNDYEYYALIAAHSEIEAIELYGNAVMELVEEDKELRPVEITKDKAFKKLKEACGNEESDFYYKFVTRQVTCSNEGIMMLVDGTLF